ncbi:diaminobutyrate acetyltransferase [Gimesia chilikensis]|jgi:L-2,4-diaminobutyric acid acetyltransferase|uniref:L-2,4-diaminobutyric acid acetyltransferase n=1 Tax=Gimesia chilikensis TaxID=2605989 RepID=A0A517PUB2_9PLAN|nr:diaminobutyrate acetyltransferase [Gimesia chilikensis]MBN68206.1 diaminobutyrate acetyltransferase [Gimesia sp.]MCR9233395.1 diaminobutyrate acetyltransferase [bacterium]QDT22963.1 L-2,4-diaminobutyric acid acetyltransferase [Gimesia chilikensis]QDT86870.1 L-2,4-diaminobutyric acid acetyltransferase [Gimesia chilikensis]
MDTAQKLIFREPRVEDALAISRLIKRCPPLDVNSTYATMLLCRDFHDTCVVVEQDSEVLAFLSAYRPPQRENTIFIWQAAVDSRLRSQGVASRMLDDLLSRESLADVNHLETTITPSNQSSQKLFRSLAKRLNTECRSVEGFPAALFGEVEEHEAEDLYQLGPFTLKPVHGEKPVIS